MAALGRIGTGTGSREETRERVGLVVLTVAALGLRATDTRTAAAQPVGYRSAADLVEAQYRPNRGSYRAERRA